MAVCPIIQFLTAIATIRELLTWEPIKVVGDLLSQIFATTFKTANWFTILRIIAVKQCPQA